MPDAHVSTLSTCATVADQSEDAGLEQVLARYDACCPEGHTPHASAGVVFSRWTRGSLTLDQTGFFATAGPEWRWSTGVRLLLGVGALYVPAARTSNGTEYLRSKRLLGVDLELGVRYAF